MSEGSPAISCLDPDGGVSLLALESPISVSTVGSEACRKIQSEFCGSWGSAPFEKLLSCQHSHRSEEDPMAGQTMALPNAGSFESLPPAGRHFVQSEPSRKVPVATSPLEDNQPESVIDSFEGIVGASPALKEVLDLVRTVAPTDSTVLIEGETGTGKELIAQAVHTHSRRRHCPFMKLNCAAIPVGLLESELFGHERGAFTGALARKIGRFEAANGGTLFLDEIGDIPLELQAKLLRVLQEGEFERLGSTQTIRVNVRLVAATNADLSKMVSEKRF